MTETARLARNAAIVFLAKQGFDVETISDAVFVREEVVKRVLTLNEQAEMEEGEDEAE